jgi:hypothetical protein
MALAGCKSVAEITRNHLSVLESNGQVIGFGPGNFERAGSQIFAAKTCEIVKDCPSMSSCTQSTLPMHFS